ncbi:MAG: ATP-binding protein [Marinilabiliaceae bacterium]|nr:ATP-binding protein [Marinilabiliaceae bacterium]
MNDLSMHILDIVRNSVEANANDIFVSMNLDAENFLTIKIEDNGRGMSPEFVKNVINPFVTTRTTRKVGMGLPLLKMSSEMTGGTLNIESEQGKGTVITVSFNMLHIDCIPLGNLGSVFSQLLGGNPNINFLFNFVTIHDEFTLKSDEVWEMMSECGITQLKTMILIKDLINENLKEIGIK